MAGMERVQGMDEAEQTGAWNADTAEQDAVAQQWAASGTQQDRVGAETSARGPDGTWTASWEKHRDALDDGVELSFSPSWDDFGSDLQRGDGGRELNEADCEARSSRQSSVSNDDDASFADRTVVVNSPDDDDDQEAPLDCDQEEHLDNYEDTPLDNDEDVSPRHGPPSTDETGDSSSHHEHDVFSDGISTRSSLGSMSEAEQTKIEQTLSQRNITHRSRSPRISDLPLSHADDFVYSAVRRATPRPPFRSPSSVQALQMTSPPASAGPGSPRATSRRLGRFGSTQYSPKKTPPRFRRATPPLVLLHATLLPLRWPWGRVMDGLPLCAQMPELSHGARTLREAWRQLRDRTGDTVSDRGVLLPHPQGDYEVMQERLLEALELPQRRRARILECGHYLGPANEVLMDQDDDSDDGDAESEAKPLKTAVDKTHWCQTCRSEIRYDSLGEGTVFRVKVYASNGLMRAGAWEACWREMERIDVEIEPIVDAALLDELTHLAAEVESATLELQDTRSERDYDMDEDEVEPARKSLGLQDSFEQHMQQEPDDYAQQVPSTPLQISESTPARQRQRARDDAREERLREIYGSSPRTLSDANLSVPLPHPHAQMTPRSPASAVLERRRHDSGCGKQGRWQEADSLPRLLLRASQVFFQRRKMVVFALVLLLLAVLGLGVRLDFGHQISLRREVAVATPAEYTTLVETSLAVLPTTLAAALLETPAPAALGDAAMLSGASFGNEAMLSAASLTGDMAFSAASLTDEAMLSAASLTGEMAFSAEEATPEIGTSIVSVIETITQTQFETQTEIQTQTETEIHTRTETEITTETETQTETQTQLHVSTETLIQTIVQTLTQTVETTVLPAAAPTSRAAPTQQLGMNRILQNEEEEEEDVAF